MTGLDNMTKADHAPSDMEKQEIVAATARHRERAPRVAVNIRQPEDAAVEISPTHLDGSGWQTRLKDALGTSSNGFVDVELARLMTIFRDRAGVIDAGAVNGALAVIDGLKPQNEIEATLAVQIAVTHALVMKFSARLYSGSIDTIPQQDSAALTLSRLQRAFTRGVSGENSGQAHATDDKRTIAASGSAPMWCPDAAREALPVSNSEGQEAVSDARGSARHRSPKGRSKRKLPARLLHGGSHSRTARRKGAAS